jgi:hypothetical protein
MIAINVNQTPRVHVRFEGHSYDFTAAEFNLNPQPSDADVRLALAMFFEVPISRLAPYVIERHGNGNLTVRPEAVFG